MASSPYYRTQHWRELRLLCLERDRYSCRFCGRPANVADHVVTRPDSPLPTPLDVLENLRSLCGDCDRRVKELPGGRRRNDGSIRVRGCDVNGMPFDPRHRR